MTSCASCGLTTFEPDPSGRLICCNCDHPQPPAAVPTAPCAAFRCGQPVPANSQPWQRCLTCGQPIKINRKVGAR